MSLIDTYWGHYVKDAVDISWCSRLAGEDQSSYIRWISVNSVFLLTNTLSFAWPLSCLTSWNWWYLSNKPGCGAQVASDELVPVKPNRAGLLGVHLVVVQEEPDHLVVAVPRRDDQRGGPLAAQVGHVAQQELRLRLGVVQQQRGQGQDSALAGSLVHIPGQRLHESPRGSQELRVLPNWQRPLPRSDPPPIKESTPAPGVTWNGSLLPTAPEETFRGPDWFDYKHRTPGVRLRAAAERVDRLAPTANC